MNTKQKAPRTRGSTSAARVRRSPSAPSDSRVVTMAAGGMMPRCCRTARRRRLLRGRRRAAIAIQFAHRAAHGIARIIAAYDEAVAGGHAAIATYEAQRPPYKPATRTAWRR